MRPECATRNVKRFKLYQKANEFSTWTDSLYKQGACSVRVREKGVIPLQELADTVHGAVDYALRTGKRTGTLDRAVLFLVTNGIRTDDFMEYGRGGKAER